LNHACAIVNYMTQFCEGCPLRGECTEEITSTYGYNTFIERQYYQFTDSTGGASLIIHMGKIENGERVTNMIDRCPGPITSSLLFFSGVHCGALGDAKARQWGHIAKE